MTSPNSRFDWCFFGYIIFFDFILFFSFVVANFVTLWIGIGILHFCKIFFTWADSFIHLSQPFQFYFIWIQCSIKLEIVWNSMLPNKINKHERTGWVCWTEFGCNVCLTHTNASQLLQYMHIVWRYWSAQDCAWFLSE